MFQADPEHLQLEQQKKAPVLDTREFRNALGSFATGITIISSIGRRGEPIGLTANSFNSVSLDPPLVLFSLARNANTWREFLSTHYFAVNILSTQQQSLSNRFAQPMTDKWAGIDYETWETGCPILNGCLANFECEYRYTHDGGDHVIFVGEVLKMRCQADGEPLIYFRGRYAELVHS